jgi:hypothetical protein
MYMRYIEKEKFLRNWFASNSRQNLYLRREEERLTENEGASHYCCRSRLGRGTNQGMLHYLEVMLNKNLIFFCIYTVVVCT